MKPVVVLVALALGAAACSSAPAKNIPPVAEEVNKPAPLPADEEEFEEEVEEEEETVSFECGGDTMEVVVTEGEPATATAGEVKLTVTWSGDLNGDEVTDYITRETACSEKLCAYTVYLGCGDATFMVGTATKPAMMVNPLENMTDWQWLEVTLPGESTGEEASENAIETLEWKGDAYGPTE